MPLFLKPDIHQNDALLREAIAARRAAMTARRAALVRRSVATVKRIPLIRTLISPADVLTLANGLCGLMAIAVLTNVVRLYEPPFFPGLATVWPAVADDRFLLALLLITLGLVFDSFDGLVARRFGGSPLGADLDTLSDAITFVVTPALLVMSYYGSRMPFDAFLTGSLVFVMGVLRLARFNTNPTETETKTFQGLPTPWCAMTISLTVLAGVQGKHALPFIAVLAFLMMSSFSYPKSRERVRYLPYLMMVSAMIIIGLIWYFPNDQSRIVRTVLVVVAITVALFPFLIAQQERRARREAATNGKAADLSERLRLVE